MSDCHAHTAAAGMCSTQLRRLIGVAIATASLLASIPPGVGRADETLFASNFPSDRVGFPPSHNQGVGTAASWGPRDSVLTNGNGLLLTKLHDPDEVGFRGRFSHTRGYGNYTVVVRLILLPLANVAAFKATLDFEPHDQQTHPPARLLRLEFLPNGQLRFDENNSTRFGHYIQNEGLVMTITLSENQTLPGVHVNLHHQDGGPDSTADYVIQKPLRDLAREFGAVTISLTSHQFGQVKIDSILAWYCAC